MPTGRKEPADQPARVTITRGGSVGAGTAADLKAAAGNAYVFADTVTVTYRAHTLTFRSGCAYSLHPDLRAFLAAGGITPTAA